MRRNGGEAMRLLGWRQEASRRKTSIQKATERRTSWRGRNPVLNMKKKSRIRHKVQPEVAFCGVV